MNLVQKLAKIMSEIGYIEKSGRNEFHKYDYVREADVADEIRKHFSKANLVMVPFVESVDLRPVSEKGFLATLLVRFTILDGDDSENLGVTVKVAGSGYDTPGDKAVYKAMTGAEKYALLKLLLIPTGDDPERDEEAHHASRRSSGPVYEDPGKGAGKDATPESKPADSDRAQIVSFGKAKGKALQDLSSDELAWWTERMEEAANRNDPKWHRIDLEKLEAARKEWARRKAVSTTSKEVKNADRSTGSGRAQDQE